MSTVSPEAGNIFVPIRGKHEVSLQDLAQCIQKGGKLSERAIGWIKSAGLSLFSGRRINEKFVKEVLGNLKPEELVSVKNIGASTISALAIAEIHKRSLNRDIGLLKQELTPGDLANTLRDMVGIKFENESLKDADLSKLSPALRAKISLYDRAMSRKVPERNKLIYNEVSSDISRELQGAKDPATVWERYFPEDPVTSQRIAQEWVKKDLVNIEDTSRLTDKGKELLRTFKGLFYNPFIDKGGQNEITFIQNLFVQALTDGAKNSKELEKVYAQFFKVENMFSAPAPTLQRRQFSLLSSAQSILSFIASKAKAVWSSVGSFRTQAVVTAEVKAEPTAGKVPIIKSERDLTMEGIKNGWMESRLEERLLIEAMMWKKGLPENCASMSWEEKRTLAKGLPDVPQEWWKKSSLERIDLIMKSNLIPESFKSGGDYKGRLYIANHEYGVAASFDGAQRLILNNEWEQMPKNLDEDALKQLEQDMLAVVYEKDTPEGTKMTDLRGVFSQFVKNNKGYFDSIEGNLIKHSNDVFKEYISGRTQELHRLVEEQTPTVMAKLKELVHPSTEDFRKGTLFEVAERIINEAGLPEKDEQGISLHKNIACNKALSTNVVKELVEAGFTPPSAKSYIEKFSGREWKDTIPHTIMPHWERTKISGYEYTKEQHALDKQELEGILLAHNKHFEKDISRLDKTSEGILAKQDVSSEPEIFVRADLHSDLHSLLAQLELLQGQGKLDENFHCKPGFKMVFLGDYIDRGHNDIEMLSLILKLRMEDPENILFIRGNHEDPDLRTIQYSSEGEWMKNHKAELGKCYKSLPVAVYIGAEEGVTEKGGRKEYMQFSHAAFSLDVDPTSFLRGKNPLAVITKKDSFERIKEGQKGLTEKQKGAAVKLRKAQIVKNTGNIERIEEGFMEYDIVSQEEAGMDASGFQVGEGKLKRRHKISPELFHAYAQMGDTGEAGKTEGGARLKGFMRGHTHEYKEFAVKRKDVEKTKVIGTTLAVGVAGGEFGLHPVETQLTQGLLLKVKPRVRDWEKTPVYFEGKGKELKLVPGQQTVTMYEKLPPKTASASPVAT